MHDDTWCEGFPGVNVCPAAVDLLNDELPRRRVGAQHVRGSPAQPSPPRILVTHPDPFERLARASSTMRAR